MNKLVIPSIAVIAVLMVGAISFTPVDKASAVHTTLLANIEDQERFLSLTVDNGSGAGLDDLVLATIATGQVIAGEVLITSAGTGVCDLQDDGDNVLVEGGANTIIQGALVIGQNNFNDDDDLEIEVPDNTTCHFYIHFSQYESP